LNSYHHIGTYYRFITNQFDFHSVAIREHFMEEKILDFLKGTVSRDFWPLVFFANRLPLGHRWTP
jgi:hypothetical protein